MLTLFVSFQGRRMNYVFPYGVQDVVFAGYFSVIWGLSGMLCVDIAIIVPNALLRISSVSQYQYFYNLNDLSIFDFEQ